VPLITLKSLTTRFI